MSSNRPTEKVLWRGEHVEVRELPGHSGYVGHSENEYYPAEVYVCNRGYYRHESWSRRTFYRQLHYGRAPRSGGAVTEGRLTDKKRAACVDVGKVYDTSFELIQQTRALVVYLRADVSAHRSEANKVVSRAESKLLQAARRCATADALAEYAVALRDAERERTDLEQFAEVLDDRRERAEKLLADLKAGATPQGSDVLWVGNLTDHYNRKEAQANAKA